jgi:hypothetical protein
VTPEDLAARDLLDVGEVRATVDPHADQLVGGEEGRDPVAPRAQERQHVAEVGLALGVVGPDLDECLEEGLDGERIGAGVHLLDRELLRRCIARVLGLDDSLDVAVGRADDATVLAGVLELAGGDRRRGARRSVPLGERGHEAGVDQRVIAREHDHVARPGKRLLRG